MPSKPDPTRGSAATRTRKTLALNALLLLVMESSRGLFVASLYQYALALAGGEASVAQRDTAIAVACYSVGRLVAAPLWGHAADRLPFRSVFLACLVVAAGGHMAYAMAEARGGGVVLLIAARCLVGLGSGVLGVCRAVVAKLTPPDARTAQYSVLSLAKFVGYAVTPVFAIGFGDPPDNPVHAVRDGPHWDAFTRPAMVLAAISLATMAPVWLWFDPELTGATAPSTTPPARDVELVALTDVAVDVSAAKANDSADAPTVREPTAPATPPLSRTRASSAASAPPPPHPSLLRDPAVAAGVATFMLVNGVSKGVLTLMEAVAAPLFLKLEDGARKMDDSAATSDTAIWFAQLGAVGFVVYALMALPRKGISWAPSDLSLLVASCMATAAGALVLAQPWGGEPTLAALTVGAGLVWSVGAPVADVTATSCFSIVVAGKAQGAFMGYLTMAGSVGRIAMPLLAVAGSDKRVLATAAALSAAGVPALLVYKALKARMDATPERAQLLPRAG